MKKINSIDYGGKIIFIGIFLSFLFPLLLKIIYYFFELEFIMSVSKISYIIGIIMLALFFILLAIELLQDDYLNKHYNKQKKIKIILNAKSKTFCNHEEETKHLTNPNYTDGTYECANCGNRHLSKEDKQCNVCGIHFISSIDKTPK